MLAEVVFWISAGALLHSYLLYPLLLKALTFGRNTNATVYSVGEEPGISVLIAAYNEEKVISEKIKSVFECGYPHDKLQVLVGSDCSTDGTGKAVHELAERYPSLRLVTMEQRSGKSAVVHHLVGQSRNEILVLTDANVLFEQGTLFELVKHFRNETVSLVDSNMINTASHANGIARQERFYIHAEVWIKQAESLLAGCMMGPFGGCYALRRKHYAPVPPRFLVDDFYINMRVLEQGGRCINELKARVYEEVSHSIREEFRRKTRIATGNFQNLAVFWKRLFRFDAVAFCFFSHKVLRWTGPLFMLAVLGSALSLSDHPVYRILFFLQVGLYAVPAADALTGLLGLRFAILRLITHFLAMNLAMLAGLVRYARGVKSGVWQPTQRGIT